MGKKNSVTKQSKDHVLGFITGFIVCFAALCCGYSLGLISILPPEINQSSGQLETCKIDNSKQQVEGHKEEPINHLQRDWRWSPSGSCRKGTNAYNNLRIKPSEKEFINQKLDAEHLKQAIETFRACGVVAIEPGFENHLDMVNKLDASLQEVMNPLLASRARVRSELREAMLSRSSLRNLWNSNISNELLFEHGDIYRERDDGRIDQALPWYPPFNDSNLVINGFSQQLLGALLGDKAELKSLHAIHALGLSSDGSSAATTRTEQHWHRDTELLYSTRNDDLFESRDVHVYGKGFFGPPHAINLFIPLKTLTERDGPTEFTLGSHLWGDEWYEWEQSEKPLNDFMFTENIPGTFIFSDYRTIHRGTVNSANRARTILMLIYGRDWWEDRINYGGEDYGGVNTKKARNGEKELSFANNMIRKVSSLSMKTVNQNIESILTVNHASSNSDCSDTSSKDEALKRTSEKKELMFWGLSRLWEEGLRIELQQEMGKRAMGKRERSS